MSEETKANEIERIAQEAVGKLYRLFGSQGHVDRDDYLNLFREALCAAQVKQPQPRVWELLVKIHPAHVWDMARQHFTRPNPPLQDVLTIERDRLCALTDEILSASPQNDVPVVPSQPSALKQVQPKQKDKVL